MKTVPRIKLDDKHSIRILVCHLIYSLGCPLTKQQLAEITSLEQAVNYFDLMDALEGIDENLCTTSELDGDTLYTNTKLGDAAAREFCSDLPASIREKMFEEAVKVYTRDAMKKDKLYAVRYAESQNGSCTIGISIKDSHTGKQKYYLNIYTEDKDSAEKIKNRIKTDPAAFNAYLDRYFE
ncbi:MAG: DUF4364 family protein [Oscillospiraceae bacterium]